MFIRNQLRFFNSSPTFPAAEGDSFGAAQAGLGGEVLGMTMGAGKDLAHNSLLVIRYWLFVPAYSLRVICSFNE
jgi:hypothetical protein